MLDKLTINQIVFNNLGKEIKRNFKYLVCVLSDFFNSDKELCLIPIEIDDHY